MGVDFSLYVDKPTYESWLRVLKGLVSAKERESRNYRKTRMVRSSRLPSGHSPAGPSSRSYSSTYRNSSHRARSTSPTQTRPTLPYPYPSQAHPAHPVVLSPTPRSGSKRSAEAAFSPTSASFSHVPSKRPVSISLHIPDFRPGLGGPSSNSPLGLQGFSKMTLASPHAPQPSHNTQSPAWESSSRHSVPETLVTAYSLDEGRRASVPQVRF